MIDHSINHSTLLLCKAEPLLDAKLIRIIFWQKLLKWFLFQLSQKMIENFSLLIILIISEVLYGLSKSYLKNVFHIALISH